MPNSQVLTKLLKPGGTLDTGIYSQHARRNVVLSRAHIAARGYEASNIEHVRQFRADVYAAAEAGWEGATAETRLLVSIARCTDFFVG